MCYEARGGSNEAQGGVTHLRGHVDVPPDVGDSRRAAELGTAAAGQCGASSGCGEAWRCLGLASSGRGTAEEVKRLLGQGACLVVSPGMADLSWLQGTSSPFALATRGCVW